ncbi:17461_t:CDS:2, partial [Funneliformis geosporum]
MDALTTLRTEINRLGFTSNEQDNLRNYFTKNVEKKAVAVSFLSDYTMDDGKRDYLKSLISTPDKKRKIELGQILQDFSPGEVNLVNEKSASAEFVDRDDGLIAANQIFINNSKGRKSQHCQDTYFGLCFSGCGIGKTELVTQFCMKMIKEYKNVLVLDLNKDFHSFNRNACKEDQWLGLSLATVYYGGRKTSLSAFIQTIICKYGEESLMAFDDVTEVLRFIVNHYRKWKSIKETLCVVIWKDDYQNEMEQFSNPQLSVIQKIGNYNYMTTGKSIAAEQDVIIVPILSGIFGGDVKKSIIGSRYSAKILSTPPLSFDASIRVLGISKDILEQSPFKLRILISDIGGVARLL